MTRLTLLAAALLSAMILSTAVAVAEDDKPKSEDSEAKKIIAQADEATKKIKTAKYHANVEGFGWVKERVPKADGEMFLGGKNNDDLDRFYVDLRVTQPGSEEAVHVTAGSNGDMTYLIDHAKKTAYEDMDPAVLGSNSRFLFSLMMQEYTHPAPFSDELKADSRELKGKVMIGDEECHEVHVLYEGGRAEATWFFSIKDHLPRRVDRIFRNRQGDGEIGGTRLVVSNLDVSPKFTDKTFRLQLPEGYTKSDDFAP
jgi:opacity protein-like surface antigen